MSPPIFKLTVRPRASEGWPVAVEQRTGGGFLPMGVQGQLELDMVELRALEPDWEAYGSRLGASTFSAQVRELFAVALGQAAGPLRLLLTVEAAELTPLAWEHLRAPVDGAWRPLALSQRVIYAHSVTGASSHPFPPVARGQLRALVLAASPADLPRYQIEPFDAAEALASLRDVLSGTSTTLLGPAPFGKAVPSLDELCRALSAAPHHILHLVCHGRVAGESGETVLYLARDGSPQETEPVTGTQLLARLDLLGPALPRLIFLSSCATAHRAQDAPLRGLAQRLVSELGVPAVVAMTQPISVQTAGGLARGFYRKLLEHGEPDRALAEASAGLAGHPDSKVPALFSRLEGASLFSSAFPLLTSAGSGSSSLAPSQHDEFFERWVQALSRLQMYPDPYARALIDTLTAALSAELGGMLERQGAIWAPAELASEAYSRELRQAVGLPYVQQQLDQAATEQTACRIEPYYNLGGMLAIPFPDDRPTGFLIFTGVKGPLLGDLAVELVLKTVLRATDNLRTQVESRVLEMRAYHALRQRFGPVSDAMYMRQYELFRSQLVKTAVFFEPIVYLHPTAPYAWGWEAQLRDPEIRQAPADLAAIAATWGRRFQVELDMHTLRTAAQEFVLLKQHGREPRLKRKSELSRLFVPVHPATLVRTRYLETAHEVYLTGHLPGNRLTLEISERHELPQLEAGTPYGDPLIWLHDRIMRYKQYDIEIAVGDVQVNQPTSERLLRLGATTVKLDHSSFTYRFNEATRGYETTGPQDLPAHVRQIVSGFDHGDLFPLQALFDRGIHYVQGSGIEPAGFTADRILTETYNRIRTALQAPLQSVNGR